MVEGYGSQTYYELMRKQKGQSPDAVNQIIKTEDGRVKTNGGLTRCQWANDPQEQKNKCKFHEDASQAKRCMYLHFDEYCDYFERGETK